MKSVAEIPLAPRDRRAIAEASSLLRRDFPVEEVILFGSKARGDDRADSDIDILILTTYPLDWRQRDAITDALYPLQLELERFFSPIIVSGEEWRHGVYQALPLRQEIDRDGAIA